MGNMHQALRDLKQEVNDELLYIKNEWKNKTLNILVFYSPTPGRAPYSRGRFIDRVILKYNGKKERFKYAWNNHITREDPQPRETKKPWDFENYPSNVFIYYNKDYVISDPHSNVSITSLIYYNKNIEFTGWDMKSGGGEIKPPYRSFAKTLIKSTRLLDRLCNPSTLKRERQKRGMNFMHLKINAESKK